MELVLGGQVLVERLGVLVEPHLVVPELGPHLVVLVEPLVAPLGPELVVDLGPLVAPDLEPLEPLEPLVVRPVLELWLELWLVFLELCAPVLVELRLSPLLAVTLPQALVF